MLNRFSFLFVALSISALAGCSAVKTVETHAYIQDKPRVDQDREYGNAGYISGTKPADTNQYKENRKVFVLEVSKKPIVDETDVKVEEELKTSAGESTLTEVQETKREEIETTPKVTLPDFDDKEFYKDESVQKEPTAFEDYIVQKDDTLQKISKAKYGSYSKWPRIYDANRDVINDPDHLKPGITIRIPTN